LGPPEGTNIASFLIYKTLYQKVNYKNKAYPWASIIPLKMEELGEYLEG
jgi:hypothetical protein